MVIAKYEKILNKKLLKYKTSRIALKKIKKDISKYEQEIEDTKEAVEIAQNVAQLIQQEAHQQITKVVHECIVTVFGKDSGYSFKIEFKRKRNKTEAQLILLKDGNEIINPLHLDSGGVIDVASFALRISCIMLSKPKLRRLFIADEPFKSVSEAYKHNVRVLVEKISKTFDFQIIMVTHDKDLMTGKIIKLR